MTEIAIRTLSLPELRRELKRLRLVRETYDALLEETNEDIAAVMQELESRERRDA